VEIPADRKVVQKEAEKKLKYKSLGIDLQWMWNLKCAIIPVITGATGIVTRSLRKNLEDIPGKYSIDSLQKTAILGTSHIIGKVLQCEGWSPSVGDHPSFTRSTGKKRPVTRDDNNNNNSNNNLCLYFTRNNFIRPWINCVVDKAYMTRQGRVSIYLFIYWAVAHSVHEVLPV